MSIRVEPLTLDTVHQLPPHTSRCLFWEIDPDAMSKSHDVCDSAFEKEAWISSVLLGWGSCGQFLFLDNAETNSEYVAGCAIYAPPNVVPRAKVFPTSPVSADAILLTTLYVDGFAEAEGFHQTLIQAVVADLVRRGVRAIEAFGHERDGEISWRDFHAVHQRAGDCRPHTCMISAARLRDADFIEVAPHPEFPRFRIELDSDHGWKADVESALTRLLESASLTMTPPAEPGKVSVGG
ncbi:GNAT family N-acetyltransferase [Hoyosella rhizosphaerae]|uniref:GNAT family N-acetyltransferase n=1 Tax=Hoyosella rhizosphaerae TaxID=1755582 RepID=A0A916U959_9ACTN|nr:GNAT family N-acetyltransferase [Hoyosella rhizosphaerae]MBN4927488.1 GNAT family N-acetyltransferase [Hoyosella rhizosphaerae]GGC64073.1 hypothetical protein GCM10011410_15680 [Hoyosella rhizosphaerae]